MKRITPALFLTLASWMAADGHILIAQEPDLDLAPGPIAELLPDDAPLSGFGAPASNGSLGDNPLPSSGSSSRQPPAPSTSSAPPLFNAPAAQAPAAPVVQPPSASVRSTPPAMPAEVWSAPRTPRSIHNSGSTVSQPPVYPNTPNADFSTQENVVDYSPQNFSGDVSTFETVGGSEIVGDCGCGQVHEPCDTCDSGQTFDQPCDTCDTCETFEQPCDTCGSGEEVVFVEDSNCEGECEFVEAETTPQEVKKPRKSIFSCLHRKKEAKRSLAANAPDNHYVEDGYNNGYVEGDYVDGGPGQGGYIDGGNLEGEYVNGHNQQPVVAPIDYGQQDLSGVNTLLGVSGLYFTRNYEDNQQLSASRFAGERGLFSNDADHDDFGGVDANLIRRQANGKGIEFRYFGFTPGDETATLGGNPFTTIAASDFGPDFGLNGVGIPGELTAADAFNLAEVHQVTRETTIHNAEFNLLRMGRTPDRRRGGDGSRVNFEYLAGFRYLKFDESLNYSAQAIRPVTGTGSNLLRADYNNEVSNDLYGAQIGGRSEICLGRKFSLIIGTKAGIFNNRFSNQQNVSFRQRNGSRVNARVLGGPFDGAGFNTDGEDDDITMLGELDLGLTYRMFANSRIRGGYKAIFVSDVAFAADQTEFFFQNLGAVQQPEANDDLVLHGGYLGMEFAF